MAVPGALTVFLVSVLKQQCGRVVQTHRHTALLCAPGAAVGMQLLQSSSSHCAKMPEPFLSVHTDSCLDLSLFSFVPVKPVLRSFIINKMFLPYGKESLPGRA